MIAKNQQMRLTCTRLGAELEGIGEYQGQTVFLPGALPGEEVAAKVVKVHPRYAFAKLEEVLNPSPRRAEPPCPAYGRCGGCSGQHMDYALTLEAKRQQVLDCLTRIGGFSLVQADVPPVLGAEEPYHSRNKMALPVGGTAEAPLLGFYRRRSHQLVPVEGCPIAMGPVEGVIAAIKTWMKEANIAPYQETTGEGLLRHVVTRISRDGSLMVILVATRKELPKVALLIEKLQDKAPGFSALHLSVNTRRDNVILGEGSQRLHGAEALTETLLGLRFSIAPLSFFQVNPAQTERLYRTAIDFARLTPGDLVVDAYAGAGTIALCMARQAKQIIGIECVPQAVQSAEYNARQNGISNAIFHTATVEEKLPALVAQGLRPQVVVLDPPRKGIDTAVVEAVLKAGPSRLVYVSCHVPSQARDMALLRQGGYRLAACQPVDMFCYGGGVENVSLMVREEAVTP